MFARTFAIWKEIGGSVRICGNMKEYEAEACWFLLVFGGTPEKRETAYSKFGPAEADYADRKE